jgi:hypothetical protein
MRSAWPGEPVVSEGSLHDVSVAIGELRGDIRGLGEKIDRAERDREDATRRADEHRAVIHKRVDDLVAEVGGIANRVSVLEPAVIDSKAVTDEFQQWRQRGIGALFVAGIAGTAIGGAFVGFVVWWWESILRLLRAA